MARAAYWLYTAHQADLHCLPDLGDPSLAGSLCSCFDSRGQRSRFRDAVDRLLGAARRQPLPRTLASRCLIALPQLNALMRQKLCYQSLLK